MQGPSYIWRRICKSLCCECPGDQLLALKVPLFIDDFGRSLSGSYDWSKDGRPLAELIYRFLMLGSEQAGYNMPLVDSGAGEDCRPNDYMPEVELRRALRGT